MEDWQGLCDLALRHAGCVGLDSPHVREAMEEDNPDVAMIALSLLIIVLMGAEKALASLNPNQHTRAFVALNDAREAAATAKKALEAAAAAAGLKPVDENLVCPVDF